MASTRLFIGGLSNSVTDSKLTDKVGRYGEVTDVDIKRKIDPTGKVVSVFAFVSIKATREKLEACLGALNESRWMGSSIRIEVAKESFLDRLRRERAEAKGGNQTTSSSVKSSGPQNVESSSTKEYKVFPNEKLKWLLDKKEPSIIHIKKAPVLKDRAYLIQRDKNSAKRLDGLMKRHGQMKKNMDEEEMLESFKSFSSIWADTDEEDDDGDAGGDDDDGDDDDDDGDDDGRVISNKEKKRLENKAKRTYSKTDNQPEIIEEDDDDDVSGQRVDKRPSQEQGKRQNWGFPVKAPRREGDAPSKTMTRYDPTLQEHQQFRVLPPASSEKADEQVTKKKKKRNRKVTGAEKEGDGNVISVEKERDGEEKSVEKEGEEKSVEKEGEEKSVEKEEEKSVEKEDGEEKSVEKEVDGDGKVTSVKKEGDTIESSCFSLLTMFNQMHSKNKEAAKEAAKVAKEDPLKEAPAQLPVKKVHSFFLSRNDVRIQGGINWMMQNVEDKILPEFKEIENDLYDVIKTRSNRAKKQLNKELADTDRGRGRGRGRFFSRKRALMPLIEEQNNDHGWRLAALVMDDKKKGSGQNSQGEKETRGEGNTSGQDNRGRGRGERGGRGLSRGRHEGNDSGRGRDRSDWGEARGDRMDWGDGRGDRRDWGKGRGDRGQGRDGWGRGCGDRDLGSGDGVLGRDGWGQGRGDRDQGREGWGQGRGDRDQGQESWGQGRGGRGRGERDSHSFGLDAGVAQRRIFDEGDAQAG